MTEPTTSTESVSSDEEKPKLVAVDSQAESPQPRRDASQVGSDRSAKQGSHTVSWVLAALLAGVLVWATLQSQQLQALGERNTALGEQIQGLEVQLSATTLQIQTYAMQQELVRTVATDLAEQVARLQELVHPAPPPVVQTEP